MLVDYVSAGQFYCLMSSLALEAKEFDDDGASELLRNLLPLIDSFNRSGY